MSVLWVFTKALRAGLVFTAGVASCARTFLFSSDVRSSPTINSASCERGSYNLSFGRPGGECGETRNICRGGEVRERVNVAVDRSPEDLHNRDAGSFRIAGTAQVDNPSGLKLSGDEMKRNSAVKLHD